MKHTVPVPDPFLEFLNTEHILNLSCHENNRISYSVSVFYVPGPEEGSLIYFSSENTHHSKLILQNPYVSGTIYHKTRIVQEIRGIQFSGECHQVEDPDQIQHCREIYGQLFPEVFRFTDPPWIIRLNWMKFTDNRVEFGYRSEWGKRNDLSD